MRSFFAKILFGTLLIYPVTRGLGMLAFALVGTPPPPPPFIADVLPLYGQAAAAVLEKDGPAALDRFIARAQERTDLRLGLEPAVANACTAPPPAPGFWPRGQAGPPVGSGVFAMPISSDAAGSPAYCLTIRPLPLGEAANQPSPLPWDVLLPAMELACCTVVSLLLARHLTIPIRAMRAAAVAFAAGDLAARASPRIGHRGDEAADLAREFDRMADRIASLIEAQRRFAGDVSHEIRSPLARLGMALGLARREVGGAAPARFDRMEREIAMVSNLVRELLALASLQGGAGLARPEPFDLATMAEAAVGDVAFEWQDQAHGMRLVRGAGPVTILGDAALLKRAMENVLRNALFYAPPGTEVTVGVGRDDAWARIEVRDHGPGVPPDALGRLFEPFYRVDKARARDTGGAGLGLAICARIVTLHGGRISAANAQPRGLAVRIELPITSAAGQGSRHESGASSRFART